MKFTCESCSAHYMISDEKVGPSGVKVRCKKCGTVIHVRRPLEGAVAAASAPAATVTAATGVGLEAELGQAFDNAFGDAPTRTPAPMPTPAPDLAATQTMGEEDAARIAAGSAPPATEWYVAIGQAQVGPLPLAEVKRKWEGGDVGPDSLVWRPGMGDWAALSTVPDLAGYLAPVPQAAARAERPDARLDAAPVRREPAPVPAGDVTWKPVAASALAALASEEIATHGVAPAPKAEPRSAGGVQSLVDALPEGGGVDPTGAIPLPIKGLERTEEKKIERRSSVARGAEAARSRRSVSRAIVIGVTALALLVAGGAAAFWYMNRQLDRAPAVASAPPTPLPASEQPVAAKQPADPAPAAATAAPAAAPAPEGAVASAAQPPPATTTPPGEAPPPAAAPPAAPAAQPAPEKAVEPQRSAAPPPPRTVRREPPPRREPAREARVAKATPPPAPEPTVTEAPRKKSVLDFESNDAALDEALGGGSPSSGRSVYVPPRPGGELPAKLSSAQINESVAQRIDGLQRCVSEQKARDADATGTLKMHWIIAGDGSVRDVRCLTPEYASGQFAQCLSGVVKTIKFPRSKATGQEVTFPFKF